MSRSSLRRFLVPRAWAGLLLCLPATGFAFSPLTGVTQVSAGGEFACAVTAAGAVKCWGEGLGGKLGTGSLKDRSSPIEPVGLGSGMAGVSAGARHACAVTGAGGVKCWGENDLGQLGDGTTASSALPVDVAGLTGIASVAVGESHSCALSVAGAVACWGDNAAGQLGDGTTTARPAPAGVTGLAAGVVEVVAGGAFSCARLAAGTVKCWGANSVGQLGDGSLLNQPAPVDVTGLAGVTALGAGPAHACAVDGGAVKCWGGNALGQLGDGTTTGRAVPGAVLGLASGATDVAGGTDHSCAVVAGAVKCWGANVFGQLGDGGFDASLVPVDVQGAASGVIAVAAGHRLSCALGAGGALSCWGDNGAGQLGAGSFGVAAPFLKPARPNTTPIDVGGLSGPVASIHPSADFTCAITAAGSLECFGSNINGQMGDGTTDTPHYLPGAVTGLASGVVSAGGGRLLGAYACALTTGGAVQCWGDNAFGQLGDGSTTSRSLPAGVTGLASGVTALAVGGANACVITAGGGVKCWGESSANGDGAGVQRNAPVDVTGLGSGVAKIAVGGQHACAVTAAGGVKCWGLNDRGQLGIGTSPALQLVPADVPGLASGIQAVAAGGNNTCVLTTGGGVKCWGDNGSGQAGDGAMGGIRATPGDVAGLSSGVTAIAVGGRHACALLATGAVKCWGDNDFGQLAADSFDSATPVDVPTFRSGVVAIAAGQAHGCAVLSGGVAKCWGNGGSAELGNGASDRRPFAAAVMQGDTAPDAFGFTPQAGVPLSATRTSNTIAIAGIEVPAGIAVANGEYSIGCTASFASAPGILSPGDTVCVRHVSSASQSGTVTTTLTVGGVNGTFASTASATASGISLAGPATSVAGTAVTFTATVSGASPTGTVAFKDGAVAIAGCGAVVLASGSASCTTDALALGARSIVAEYGGDASHDTATSAPLAHLVTAPVRLVNLSTRMRVLTGENVLIGGFIIGGSQPKTVVVRARGPSLASAGIAQPLANPRLDLYSGQAVIASNDDWGSAPNAAQIVTAGFAPTSIFESAILVSLAPGAYTAIVSGADGGTGVGIVEVFEVDGLQSPLANIATRGFVQSGQDVMIAGFAVSGNAPKSLVVRARGPSLSAAGIANPLANPVIQVYNGSTLVAENDDWQAGPDAAAIQAAGFAPLAASESALLLNLPPGLYTVVVSGAGGTAGVAIVEVFAQ